MRSNRNLTERIRFLWDLFCWPKKVEISLVDLSFDECISSKMITITIKLKFQIKVNLLKKSVCFFRCFFFFLWKISFFKIGQVEASILFLRINDFLYLMEIFWLNNTWSRNQTRFKDKKNNTPLTIFLEQKKSFLKLAIWINTFLVLLVISEESKAVVLKKNDLVLKKVNLLIFKWICKINFS